MTGFIYIKVCIYILSRQISYYMISGFAGLFFGAHLANLLNMAADLVGSEGMTLCFAFEQCMTGLAALIGPPITGIDMHAIMVLLTLIKLSG